MIGSLYIKKRLICAKLNYQGLSSSESWTWFSNTLWTCIFTDLKQIRKRNVRFLTENDEWTWHYIQIGMFNAYINDSEQWELGYILFVINWYLKRGTYLLSYIFKQSAFSDRGITEKRCKKFRVNCMLMLIQIESKSPK